MLRTYTCVCVCVCYEYIKYFTAVHFKNKLAFLSQSHSAGSLLSDLNLEQLTINWHKRVLKGERSTFCQSDALINTFGGTRRQGNIEDTSKRTWFFFCDLAAVVKVFSQQHRGLWIANHLFQKTQCSRGGRAERSTVTGNTWVAVVERCFISPSVVTIITIFCKL